MHRTWSLLGIGLLALTSGVLAGCSSDGSDGADASKGSSEVSVDGNEGGTDGATDGATDDRPLVAVTGAEICEAVTVEAVAAATGLPVESSAPSDEATPQCTYAYTSDDGAFSNLTVASMRPEDVGDRALGEAYDYVVDLNRGLGGGAEEGTPKAGDRAVRLSGASLHFGIFTVDDHLLTVLVPAGDAPGTAADELAVAVADALG